MPDKKLLIIDFEATCWEDGRTVTDDGQEQEIIEIGYALANLSTETIEHNGSIFIINAKSNVSDYCTNLTGITQEQLLEYGYQDLHAGFEALQKEIGSLRRYPWASWGSWDEEQYRKYYSTNLQKPPLSRYYLNLKVQFFLSHRALKKMPGMATALDFIQTPLEGRHHSGADDAKNLAKIAFYLYGGQQ